MSDPRAADATTPTFSVIIPTFQRPELLVEAVASVVGQTRADWECLVVDDGGGLAFESPDPRVRLVSRPESGGPAAARNTGVAQARGRWLAFLDDDDRYTPRRLELAAAGLARAPVAVCWTRWFDGTPDWSPGPGRGRWLMGRVDDEILDSTTPHLGSTAVAADAMVSFDERFRAVEDVEWWLRLAERSPVDTIAEVGCEIRRHPGVRANQTDVASRMDPNQRLLDERADWFATHRRARAFRWARMGAMATSAGQIDRARQAYLRSLRARPSVIAGRGLVRTWRGG
jgi:glycosyltransferase involved in cell wall biosynthesis